MLGGEPGGKGGSDRVVGVGGRGQGVGGVGTDGGVGVVEKRQEHGRSGRDRGAGGGHRPACRVAGHLDAVVVVIAGGVAPGIVAVEQEFIAGSDAEAPSSGRAGEQGEGGGTVWVVGIGGEGNQERYGQGGGGPAVVSTQAPQHARRPVGGSSPARSRRTASRASSPCGKFPHGTASRSNVLGASLDAGHHRPHIDPYETAAQ
ncbi:hypothetical protein [Streptomyces sp. NPDC057854]|uniref:hypothetical protein n=1 Tax=unclassified Streptomyces TaxID=2593676 RepID=UPI00367E5F29